jgi:hypothetical protein
VWGRERERERERVEGEEAPRDLKEKNAQRKLKERECV